MTKVIPDHPLLTINHSHKHMPISEQIAIVAGSLFLGGLAAAVLAGCLSTTPATDIPLIAVVTVPASLCFGLPAFFVFRWLRVLNILSVLLVGIVASALVVLSGPAEIPSTTERLYLLGVGLVSSSVAWIAISCLLPSGRDHHPDNGRDQ